MQTIARRSTRGRSDGQVVVIFAGAMLLFVLLAAAVVDLSWYWTNNLRMQRAADAAALAGVVFLPGDPAGAYTAARAEASKNGYTNGSNQIVVTPLQDPTNSRRLKVTISGPINTYFARVVGITAWQARRDSKADFVLPVPMGSPQNYYGVGFYEGRQTTVTNVPGTTDWQPARASVSGGQWSNPDNARYTGSAGSLDDNLYATEDTTTQNQQWRDFGGNTGGNDLYARIPSDGTEVIDGIQVRLRDTKLTGSGTGTACTVRAEVSWNNGSNWSSVLDSAPLTTSDTSPIVGSISNTGVWGGHGWTRADFQNFRVRLTWRDNFTNCSVNRSVQMDLLEVKVQYHTVTTTVTDQTLAVNDPVSATPLDSQGFWGAVFTSGGWRENGDEYAPSHIGNGTGANATDPNPTYDSGGYDYTMELAGGSGDVRIFDPIFCATGPNGHGGSYGAGDHWTSPTANDNQASFTGGPVAVTYRLYDTNGTLANTADDGPPVATLAYDPGSSTLGDMSGSFGTPQNNNAANRQDCANNAAHNKWVTVASGLASGTYRLNVNTSIDGVNANTGAENLFSLWVKANGQARVYGSGRMAAYTNLSGGLQQFYFAQIERIHAGKTMVIDLFDPGEVSGNGFLRILSPDGNVYNYANFNWHSDDGRSGTNVSSIQTSINGAAQFNNRLVTIEVPLATTYGSTGLNPPGDITDEDGWWKIEYNVSGGNDTTTWAVNIRGNPVHLVLP